MRGLDAETAIDGLRAQVAVLGADGEILMTNRAWADFGGAIGAQPTKAGDSYLAACDNAIDDESAGVVATALRSILAGERSEFEINYPCRSPSGDQWFELRAARANGPGAVRVVISHHDITKAYLADAQRATQKALLDEIDLAVITTDVGRHITFWNRGAELLYGWTAEEVLGRKASLFAPPGTDDDEVLAELLRSGRWEGQSVAKRKDGSKFPVAFHCSLIRDEHGVVTAAAGVSVDATERVAAQRAALTAQNYLRAVTDSIGEGLFTLDADGCVTYLNHAAERLLGWSSEELHGRLMHDVSHYRHSDGTMMLAIDCPICNARGNGETVRVEDEMFLHRDGSEIPVEYTAAPFETDDGVEGCVVVFNDISERKAKQEDLRLAADKLSWIGRVQEALAEKRFVLFAQPIIDLASDEVVQHELLLRMREGADIVPPAAFLKVAEEYGLVGDIDRWVIKQAVQIAATGRPIEVNISARSVGDKDILTFIEHFIELGGADPALLVFEITETALVGDEQAARRFAERLHDLGCQLALDDFGTGYGGFTQVKQLPVDFLKIDIEFVRDLATNTGSRHVVEAIVALARGFGMQTVAEGVEDLEVLRQVRDLGVDFAQGFHLGRPAPFGDDGPGVPILTPTSEGVR